LEKVENWENTLIQPKQKTFQDVINFPNQLSAELMNLKSDADNAIPLITQGVKARYNDLDASWKNAKKELDGILKELDKYNALHKELDLPVIVSGM
ncbi:MAG: hypothetical protein OEW75_07945, partial [Cyclobacteriaceae bacterium]|nr:hypothetical protein [Cyclobacteriaceae bacterium]